MECESCGNPGERRFVAQTVDLDGLGRRTQSMEVTFCERCWQRRKTVGRPLSPYELITGERFWDHLTPDDAILDAYLRNN